MIDTLKWNEIETNTVKTYQLGEEPELIHVIKIRYNEFMVVHEDGYDMKTGEVEFMTSKRLEDKYNIVIK